MPVAGDGLVEVFHKIERARGCASNGDYAAAREGYESILKQINRSVHAVQDDLLAQRWLECARALRTEAELVTACEEECNTLRASATHGTANRQEEDREPASALAAEAVSTGRAPLGMEFDMTGSGRATNQAFRPTRTWASNIAHAAAPQGQAGPAAAPLDPDVWPDPPPRPSPAAPSSGRSPCAAARSRQLDKARPHERDRERRASGAGAGPARRASGINLSGVKAKVNTGATRAAGGHRGPATTPDAKCQVLDLMLSRFGSAEQDLVEQLGRDLIDGSPGVSWADIAGLADAKRLLKENVSLPLVMSQIFKGVLRPVKGVLLFGPPGTGKTLLAKAVATECGTTFFNVSTSTLASKYRGESEKLVRVLFEMARAAAPAVIFIDEVDALCSSRGAANEHEASRRMKTELLTQIDGMHSAAATTGGETPRIMVLAATNYPWDIDDALRRRLEKRVYIPLPGLEDRKELLRLCLKGTQVAADVSFDQVAELAEGFSGDDISNVCREAAWGVVRRAMRNCPLESIRPADMLALQDQLASSGIIVTWEDFLDALQRTNPSSCPADVERHEQFAETYGAT